MKWILILIQEITKLLNFLYLFNVVFRLALKKSVYQKILLTFSHFLFSFTQLKYYNESNKESNILTTQKTN